MSSKVCLYCDSPLTLVASESPSAEDLEENSNLVLNPIADISPSLGSICNLCGAEFSIDGLSLPTCLQELPLMVRAALEILSARISALQHPDVGRAHAVGPIELTCTHNLEENSNDAYQSHLDGIGNVADSLVVELCSGRSLNLQLDGRVMLLSNEHVGEDQDGRDQYGSKISEMGEVKALARPWDHLEDLIFGTNTLNEIVEKIADALVAPCDYFCCEGKDNESPWHWLLLSRDWVERPKGLGFKQWFLGLDLEGH